MPEVPVSVWEQIPVVIVFAFLLAGLGWLLVKIFSKAVAEINAHYSGIVETINRQYSDTLKQNNEQWQKYFNAKEEKNHIINQQVVERLEDLTKAIQKLMEDFENHDRRIYELSNLQERTKRGSGRRRS